MKIPFCKYELHVVWKQGKTILGKLGWDIKADNIPQQISLGLFGRAF